MRKSRLVLSCLAAALLVFPTGAKALSERYDSPWFRLGVGVTVSPELDDMTDDYGLDAKGDWGWFDINAGLEFPLTDTISLIPYAALYFNSIDGDGDDSVNALLVPALALKFIMSKCETLTDYWYPDADFDTYIQVEVNYGIPYTSSDVIDLDASGFGFAVLLGYQLDYGYDLALGGSYIPIEDDFENGRNLGGFLVRLNKSF
jgi:hypothetical protein